MGHKEVSDYEKLRLKRIAENKAKLETLGLPHLAFSLIASSSKQKSKDRNLRKSNNKLEEDSEYCPSDSEDQSSVNSEVEEEHERISSGFRSKGNKKSSLIFSKVKRTSNASDGLNESDFIDEEAALAQAIALSLGATDGDSFGKSLGNFSTNIVGEDVLRKQYKEKTKEPIGRKKARKVNKARVQLTEDEVIAYFFSFDETGKGYITPRDVKRMVAAHDFSWTDMEIAHMINSFNNDGDGKLSLENFRSIVSRCKMLQATEET